MVRARVSTALAHEQTLKGGGTLQLLEHAVPLDAARDDDGGGNAQPVAREVNLLGRLCVLELVDLKWVPIDTAKGRGTICECQRALTERRTLGSSAGRPTPAIAASNCRAAP